MEEERASQHPVHPPAAPTTSTPTTTTTGLKGYRVGILPALLLLVLVEKWLKED